eukprot:COSAG01_NODE_453_length_16866_cov_30.622175_4_plen_74_part_00
MQTELYSLRRHDTVHNETEKYIAKQQSEKRADTKYAEDSSRKSDAQLLDDIVNDISPGFHQRYIEELVSICKC